MSSKTGLILPNESQRLAVIGRTGSGKTHAAMWHLSQRSYMSRPWIVFDTKGDDFIHELEKSQASVKEISIDASPPNKAGIYIVRPLPSEQEEIEAFLWKVWARGRTGVYIDEGYMIGKPGMGNPALNALLTQGRSKKIPMIVLSQRPVWLTRFVWSESDFFQIFHLNDIEDRRIIKRFAPIDINITLPLHCSYWFDVSHNSLLGLKPVPDKETIMGIFDKRLRARKRFM
jgi:hypothetical protein